MVIYLFLALIHTASLILAVTIASHSPFPQYGFAQHKGYPTRQHKQAVFKHGASAIHRLTFAPLKSMSLEQLRVPEPRWQLLQQRLQERQGPKQKTTTKKTTAKWKWKFVRDKTTAS